MSEDTNKKETVFKVLANPIRREILEYMESKELATYTDLTEKFKLKSGPLYYHLKQMKQFINQDKQKKYYVTEEGKRALEIINREKIPAHRVFSIGKFSLKKFIRFFAKNPLHALIEFIILAGISIYIGWHNEILIVGNFVISYQIPLWLAYLSLIASWIFVGGCSELIARYGFKSRKQFFTLLNVSNLIFLPSFAFILITALISLISGIAIEVPAIILLILHGVFQIWSFLIIVTTLGEIKKLSVERSAIIAMVVSYIQIFALIFILL